MSTKLNAIEEKALKESAKQTFSLRDFLNENKPKGSKGVTENIYKVSLGKTKDEQKKNRQKIRSRRDGFISAFLEAKTKEEKQTAWDAWLNFAKDIYKDINKFYSSNASETSKDFFNEFVLASKEFNK